MLEVVGAIGQNAAVELGLVGRQLVELGLDAQVLVIDEQVLEAGIDVETAGGAGVDLFADAGLLRNGGRRL